MTTSSVTTTPNAVNILEINNNNLAEAQKIALDAFTCTVEANDRTITALVRSNVLEGVNCEVIKKKSDGSITYIPSKRLHNMESNAAKLKALYEKGMDAISSFEAQIPLTKKEQKKAAVSDYFKKLVKEDFHKVHVKTNHASKTHELPKKAFLQIKHDNVNDVVEVLYAKKHKKDVSVISLSKTEALKAPEVAAAAVTKKLELKHEKGLKGLLKKSFDSANFKIDNTVVVEKFKGKK